MKVFICKTQKEAIQHSTDSDKIIKFGEVFAVVPKKDYLEFLYETKERKNLK